MKTSQVFMLVCGALLLSPMANAVDLPGNESLPHIYPSPPKNSSQATRDIASTASPQKKDLINRLKAIQDRQLKVIASLDEATRKRLQESTTVQLGNQSSSTSEKILKNLADRISDLDQKRNEAHAKREIVDRMIFLIDTKWTSQPLKKFFEDEFLELAQSDLSEPRGTRLWKAYLYLSVAVREIPEPKEDVINVVESYMNFSGVLTPKTPAEFQASRNYTNGSESLSAKPVPRDSVGEPTGRSRLSNPTDSRSGK